LLVRRHGFDALIVLVTVGAVIELALRRGSPQSPRTPMWFNALAILIMVLPLFARRRFPFAAPAVYWLAAVGLSCPSSTGD
jgi:hypothetical protein